MTIEVPEHLRSGPMYEAAQRALSDAASMAASSNSVPRISLRGREFRMIENSEEVKKVRDNLDVIILGVEPAAHLMVKTFYAKGYQSGAKEPPTCSSDDGISPAAWVNEKQATHCSKCPKNVFGSATSPNGKPTKACRDSKRVWLKLVDDPKPFADRTLYGLNVTVASLKSFSEHGRVLAGLGQPPCVCVTRLVMLDKEFPELDFKVHAWVGAEEAPLALKMSEERPWKIKFANAGLALAMGGDSAGGGTALPTTLPGLPAHLQRQEPVGTQTVVDAVQQPPATPGAIDEAIKAW